MENIRVERKHWMFIVVVIFMVMVTSCSTSEVDGRNKLGLPDPKAGAQTRFEGAMSKELPFVYTTKKELSITFNGMGDKDRMEQILAQLDLYDIKATFFVPGMRVAEEPDIAKEIVSRGHELENNTLNRLDLTKLSYAEIFKEIQLANEIIEEKTGITPKYLRTKTGDYNEDVRLAAAQAGLDAVVYYSVNPQDWDMKDAQTIAEYVSRSITRGGIITLNTDVNPEVIKAIPLIAEAVKRVGYEIVPLGKLAAGGSERKPLAQIPGYDAAKRNKDYQQSKYEIIESKDTDKKEIALTFDDWGTDYKVTQILDILREYDVKSTFFLRTNGVERNPNLARAIVEEGHEVANHTYSHPIITDLTLEEIQQEVVKSHQVLTEAIQQQPAMLFRPPTGEIDDKSAKIVAAAGYPSIILYDVTSLDWDVSVSAEQITSTILKETGNGSIILLHLLDEINTAEALPAVIQELKQRGYTFVKITDWMN